MANEYAIAGPVSGDYNILLSIDGGLTYDTLASNSSHGINGLQSWQWLVPNISTSSAVIRIEDAQDPGTYAISTTPFTINRTTDVVLVTPNNGEQWIANETEDIHYTKASTVSSVDIDISTNGGSTWLEIVANHVGGSVPWQVWNQPGTDYLVRVRDQNNSCRSDNSDTLFTVLSSVDLQTVNGGEQIQAEVAPPFGSGVYFMDNVPVITDGGRFYDSGGPNSPYAPNEGFTKYFYPEVAGNKLRMFSSMINLDGYNYRPNWNSPDFYDEIIISNADGSNGQTIRNGLNTNTNSWSFTSSDPTGGIKVVFTSNNNHQDAGWELSLIHI